MAMQSISVQELKVLLHAARGLSDREIASQVYRQPKTVEGHMRAIREKLNAVNRTDAVVKALAKGFLTHEMIDERLNL